MVLSFYTLPTLGSAYLYGRRHATLTALGSVLLVCLMTWYNPVLLAATAGLQVAGERWLDITVWGGVLIVTGYSMGTLYEHSAQPDQRAAPDLSRRADDPPALHRQGRLHREPLVSRLGLRRDDRDASSTCRRAGSKTCASAALLHDIGKLDISRELLYKAARLTEEEFKHMQEHVNKGVSILEPVGGSLRRVIPIVLVASRQVRRLRLQPDARARTSRSRRASSRSPTSTTR